MLTGEEFVGFPDLERVSTTDYANHCVNEKIYLTKLLSIMLAIILEDCIRRCSINKTCSDFYINRNSKCRSDKGNMPVMTVPLE